MAPHTIADHVELRDSRVDVAAVKAKAASKQAEECDTQAEAERIVKRLSDALGAGDAVRFADIFLESGVWRDKLSFTWDQRTFNFRPAILKAAQEILPTTKAFNFAFLKPAPTIDRPYDDFAQLQFVVSFETGLVVASAVIKAVLTKDGWKIYTMHTVAEQLKQFPERAPADGHMTGTVSWETQRAMEVDAADPEVLIIGGGQNGLALAARCKAIDLDCLIVERDEEIGDKQGTYMGWYASALELNVWTKSTVTHAELDDHGKWTVKINKGGKDTRILHPMHVVMATSLCGVPYTPNIPGMDQFKGGKIRHSSAHDSSRDFVGKKVCVVGTSSSGFDTAFDCSRRGIDVTLLQRSPTYIMSLTHSVPLLLGGFAPDAEGNRRDPEEHDRIFFSTPVGPGEELARRNAKVLEDLDKPLLEALNARGLRTWRGQRNTGNSTLGQTRNGGFYFDAGACEHIIDGKIKVEQGYIKRFTENKVILSEGREREFDLIVFATGFSNLNDSIRDTLGPRIADQVGPVWGIDEEGEYRNAFRETGVSKLWIMVGFLPMTRYQSRVLALRLKALKEGISPPPYKA
ncbi:hypothetical protein ACCO45_010400 [Purpureocillium lilacinum]|uniref:Uncharacterized protein n=1 Tax=Purpureocillium lilacinum TaxID=33203 RepID=A0ACC4DFE0_PURLI